MRDAALGRHADDRAVLQLAAVDADRARGRAVGPGTLQAQQQPALGVVGRRRAARPRPSLKWHDEHDWALNVGPRPSRPVVDAGAVTQLSLKKLLPTANARRSRRGRASAMRERRTRSPSASNDRGRRRPSAPRRPTASVAARVASPSRTPRAATTSTAASTRRAGRGRDASRRSAPPSDLERDLDAELRRRPRRSTSPWSSSDVDRRRAAPCSAGVVVGAGDHRLERRRERLGLGRALRRAAPRSFASSCGVDLLRRGRCRLGAVDAAGSSARYTMLDADRCR